MSSKIKLPGKILLVAVVGGGLYFGATKAMESGLLPTPGIMKAAVPDKVALPDIKEAKTPQAIEPVAAASSKEAEVSSTLIKGAIWEWNAQLGLMYANGGAKTTKGSLMEKHGVNLEIHRQDDTNQMVQELINCSTELHGGAKQCSTGANFVIIMGDGVGQFVAGANDKLVKLGPTYKLVTIGSTGYSRGEDAFMAPPEVKKNPQAAKGLLVSGVLRDGDWNIALYFAGANNIKNNPDEHTYDPDAINWVNSQDYNTAAADYVAGKCEDRKVVKDGHPTGETKHVCVNAVVTWTPGDVTVVQKKGGLVKVLSTKENRSQMPSAIVGPKAFFDANREEVAHMLAAIFEGGDQVKTFDKAMHTAADISAKVYADQDGAYWYKYAKGIVETDAQGNKVELGGSAVSNLADNLVLFGLVPGANDNFRSTYTTFANIATQQYPDIFKDTKDEVRHIPDVKEVEDKSFITGAQAMMSEPGTAADVQVFDNKEIASAPVVAKRAYNINFDTGKASLTQSGVKQLYDLKDSLALNSLLIQVDGYTDNTGDEKKTNLPLSLARAHAVKAFLQQKAPETFPDTRFAVNGYGSKDPVADNTTPDGRSVNRRVQIVLKGQ